MTNAKFRTSNLDELFGTTTIGTPPPPPGQLDWQAIAITGAIVLIGAVITVSIITHVQKTQMEKIIIHTQTIHEEGLSGITEVLAGQRVIIFQLTNLLANGKTEAADNEASK